MNLQKPVLMVSTHIGQECNALDAMRYNAWVSANFFNLFTLLEFIPTYNKTLEFKFWIHTAESVFMYEFIHLETEESTI